MSEFSVKCFTGAEITPYIKDIAGLRIEVFREYPYLYDGTSEYEEHYLKAYTDTEESVVVAVFKGERIIGASTALPMKCAADEFSRPFIKKGFSPEKIFYFGESVLLKEFRGHGIYASFFDERERHAKSLGRFDLTTFCAVDRGSDHPLKPAGYTPLDRYWNKQGYIKREDIVTSFPWKDIDEEEESSKPMVFWLREIS